MRTVVNAAYLAIALFMLAPASAKDVCTSANMAKANIIMSAMPTGEMKAGMDREFYFANEAMNKGDIRKCNMHMMNMQKLSQAKSGM